MDSCISLTNKMDEVGYRLLMQINLLNVSEPDEMSEAS